jgi:hypothetical protein
MVVVIIVLAIGIGRGLGLRWDPLDLAGRRMEAAEHRVETLDRDLAARRLEIEGAADQAQRVQAHHHTLNAVAATTARTLERTEQADDADIPLEDDRAARLRGHDDELCRLAPAVCAPAPAEPAA